MGRRGTGDRGRTLVECGDRVMVDLDDLERRCKQNGPCEDWAIGAHDGSIIARVGDDQRIVGQCDFDEADTQLVLAAVNVLPELVAIAKAARDIIQRVPPASSPFNTTAADALRVALARAGL